MLQPDINNDPTASYQPTQTPPMGPPPRGGSRTGRAVVVTMLLALLFGVVVFAAGYEFGRGNAVVPASPSSSVATLQPGTNPQPTVPPLTGNNIETVREAVIAKVEPTVVQVNVTTGRGGGA